jgi:hypothetical protein
MLKRVVAVAVLIVALMVGVKDGRVLHMAGLTGTCNTVETLSDGTQWEACAAGKMDGRPDLTSHNCVSAGVTGTYEYWKCPAALNSAAG